MMDDTEIREAISHYKFYHIIQLTDTIATPGNPVYVPAQNLCLKHLECLDVKDKRVLDIGCRDGLFSFKAETMGAREVVGIDNDVSEPATQFLIPFFKSKIKMRQMNLYDLKPDTFGLFDIVIFPGVLYHLRYPFWGLKIIREVMKTGGHLLIETPIWHGDPNKSLLFCPTGNEGPYGNDPTSCTFFNEKGIVDTMKSMGFQTLSIEHLGDAEGASQRRDVIKLLKRKMKKKIKDVLASRGLVPATTTVTRSVLHLIYSGYDEGTFIAKYWDKTHDLHTRRAGT
jgi:SAM-dependent methyltransferase